MRPAINLLDAADWKSPRRPQRCHPTGVSTLRLCANRVVLAALLVVPAAAALSSSALAQDVPVTQKKHSGRRTAAPRPADAPAAAQAPVTASKNAAPAGALPFVPPIFTRLPGGGSFAVDTKGISVNAPDDAVKLRIGGRFQEDFSSANVRPLRIGPALADNGQGRGIDTRRAYFESYLSITGGIEAAFQYDFNSATTPIQDAVLSYHGYSPVVVTVGNFKEPFSLNQLQSDNTTTFTERSLMDTFAPGRNFGGAIGTAGDKWTFVAGAYGGNANLGIDGNGIAGAARATYAPIMTSNQVLHFGVAGSYRSLDSDSLAPSFSSKPEDFLFAKSLVTTGSLTNAADVGRVGGEVLYQFGPYRVQGEYAHVEVGGRNGQVDRSFDGGYVEAAWVINGSGRAYRLTPPYGSEFAVLSGVVIDDSQRISQGGFGVFEVAGRFSAIDLNSKTTTGGKEQDFTAGLNWYPDRNVRVMADYVHASADPAALSVAQGANVESNLFVGRVNFSW